MSEIDLGGPLRLGWEITYKVLLNNIKSRQVDFNAIENSK